MGNQSDHIIFPTHFVWWKRLENHEEIKERYIPIIDQDYELNSLIYNSKNDWDCNVTTSFFSEVSVSPIFDDYFIKNVVWQTMDIMIKELHNRIKLPIPEESHLNHMWYNKYQKGQWQEIHNHNSGNVSFSGIYLIDLNEKNNTVFYNKHNINCFYAEKSLFSTNHIEEGSVIWFPSELSHYVKPSLANRTTISFNVYSKYANISSNS